MIRGEYKLEIKVLELNEAKRALFPLDLEVSEEGLVEWLGKRVVPSNREMVGHILHALGLNIDDLKGIIDICFGLSLNDSYWVVPAGFDRSFRRYNLYENKFDEALSLVAYLGYGRLHKAFQTTPELTTGGMLRKAWRYRGKQGIWLYKRGRVISSRMSGGIWRPEGIPTEGGVSFMELCRMVMGPKQKAQLRRLIDFRFQESDLCNLPTWRMRALEEMIRERVRDLLMV